MTRTDTQREAKYTAKYVASTVGLKVAALISGMHSGYADLAQLIYPIEVAVQTYLNSATAGSPPAPIPTVNFPFYFAFARQIFARQRKGLQGDALTAEAQVVKDLWKTRGLDDTTLIALALNVFALTLT